jgi:hypothetical protein
MAMSETTRPHSSHAVAISFCFAPTACEASDDTAPPADRHTDAPVAKIHTAGKHRQTLATRHESLRQRPNWPVPQELLPGQHKLTIGHRSSSEVLGAEMTQKAGIDY